MTRAMQTPETAVRKKRSDSFDRAAEPTDGDHIFDESFSRIFNHDKHLVSYTCTILACAMFLDVTHTSVWIPVCF